jgi:hypothetical protein
MSSVTAWLLAGPPALGYVHRQNDSWNLGMKQLPVGESMNRTPAADPDHDICDAQGVLRTSSGSIGAVRQDVLGVGDVVEQERGAVLFNSCGWAVWRCRRHCGPDQSDRLACKGRLALLVPI